MTYRTEEIWCENGSSRIYGVACIPEAEGRLPLVIFSHELGNNHEAGVRYAERLAAHGYAAYVFDFCGGSAGGTQNRSDGSNSEMSVLTEASDLSAVLDAAKAWPFVDSEKVFLLGALNYPVPCSFDEDERILCPRCGMENIPGGGVRCRQCRAKLGRRR